MGCFVWGECSRRNTPRLKPSLLILMVLMIVLNFSGVVGLLGSVGLLASLVLAVLTTSLRLWRTA